MMNFSIDPYENATGEEKHSLAACLAAIEKECFSDPWSEQAFLEAFDNRVIRLMTLSDGEALVAYALYAVIAPEAELLNLAVLPSRRRQGLAAALLDYADAYLAREGVTDVFLEVRESNLAAKTLYTSRGFQAVGKRRAYYRFPTEDAIVMMRTFD